MVGRQTRATARASSYRGRCATFRRLKEVGILPRSFGEILSRLDRERSNGEWVSYLSTHPATVERIHRAFDAGK